MGGNDPYSASKGAYELLFHSYLISFFNDDPLKKLASVCAGRVFGGLIGLSIRLFLIVFVSC